MTDEDREYLIDLIEREIQRFTDFHGCRADGVLATRIANVLESEFAFVTYAKES